MITDLPERSQSERGSKWVTVQACDDRSVPGISLLSLERLLSCCPINHSLFSPARHSPFYGGRHEHAQTRRVSANAALKTVVQGIDLTSCMLGATICAESILSTRCKPAVCSSYTLHPVLFSLHCLFLEMQQGHDMLQGCSYASNAGA